MMTDESKIDALDLAVTNVIERGESAPVGDEDAAALARLAAGLRGLPNPDFRARLRAELVPSNQWISTAAFGGWFQNVRALLWSRRQRPFLAAGSSSGLAAGTCCIAGFA